jgi:predicted MPP superfamily phosphohydrolase
MTSRKTVSAFTYFFLVLFCSIGFCGKIVYPWNATTAIVKAGEGFTVWFDADAGQTVVSAVLRGSYNTVAIPSVAKQTGSWTYDTVSGGTYNAQIAVSVPAETPEERYDLILNTSAGQEISQGAVKVVRDYKTDYTIMHISDTHLCQGAKIDGYPIGLFKISVIADIANIIGPEMVFVTGDLINDTMFPPQERADFFYKGSDANDLKGMHGFHAATFSVVGNHDFLQQSQPFAGLYPEKSKFWNQYHGLQYHHFKYGSTRCMIVNTGWEGFDWAYQLADHTSWLANAGSGNLRIAAYHKSENGIMGAWANNVNLGLAVIGHNHHLAADNPYDLGGRKIQYFANSIREHFAFNLFRVVGDGSYTVVNNREAVENPADAPSLWRPRLTLTCAKTNDGTSQTNTATLVNKFDVGFPTARVRFVMPKGVEYAVSQGTVEQEFDGDSVHVVDVRIAVNANSTTTIEIKPSEVPEGRKDSISSMKPDFTSKNTARRTDSTK